jgi:Restriction endonuclease AspBHI N-terminal/Restriction endonuclease
MQDLKQTDLEIDKIYGGSRNGDASDDPFPALLGLDSGAGFRVLGSKSSTNGLKLLMLKTNFAHPDWPDKLDRETGLFTYYGDNRKPGDLHQTGRKGNLILRNLFETAHDPTATDYFPPILIFGGLGEGTYRDVKFIGLAVPGAEGLSADDDLVAIWRNGGTNHDQRFQNYRAQFTILDVPKVSREWIQDIQAGRVVSSPHAPSAWTRWLKHRKYTPLCAPASIEIRSKSQQIGMSEDDRRIISLIYERYDDAYDFEKCAMEIARLMMPKIRAIELTRPWRDGGRDAIGYYSIGEDHSRVDVEFALEAKRYSLNSGVGVKPLSRLISRLRHRQFGVLVTTSYLSDQAYKELKDDGHPVVVISAADIVRVLRRKIGSFAAIRNWLDAI